MGEEVSMRKSDTGGASAMKIQFLGVGEACDPTRFNTSLLVTAEGRTTRHYILLDCGFTTPHRYFLDCREADALDALWISHFHGDHFFGLPLLLLRFWEMGRAKPLILIGPAGLQEKVKQAFALAYPSLLARLRYQLRYLPVSPGSPPLRAAGCTWQAAQVEHAQPALALRLSAGGRSLYYSGDGRPTPASAELAKNAALIVHEAYRASGETPNHSSIGASVSFARQAGARMLALVHLAHFEREQAEERLRELGPDQGGLKVFLPEPGDAIVL